MIALQNYKRGDEMFIRASFEEGCSDAFQMRVEDFPKFGVTLWVPVREVARLEDIGNMPPLRRMVTPYAYIE
jgi:hypothetical protein